MSNQPQAQPSKFTAPDKVEQGTVIMPCPDPLQESLKGTVKSRRTMEMGVTKIKGQPVELHTYIREDM